jgi:small conductance mechanosensitive channel
MTPTPTPFAGILPVDDPLVQVLINVIRALLVLVVALVIARYAKQWVVRLFTRSRVSLNVATLLGNLMQVAIVTVGIIFVLPTFGVDWTGLLALVGAAGLAISLSMQDLLKNVVAGIYILMEQPFRIGDRISVKEATGVVQGIELRTTVLCTDENLQVVVPNNVILNEILTNRSASNLQRQIIRVAIRGRALAEMSQEVIRVIKDFAEVAASPAPTVALEEFNEGVARLRVEFWLPADIRLASTPQIVEALQSRFPDASVTVV